MPTEQSNGTESSAPTGLPPSGDATERAGELAEPTVLNLGCGTRTSASCVNIDWTPYIRVAQRPVLRRLVAPVLGATRRRKLDSIEGAVVAHDLRKGIPFEDRSVDGVYLSHVLEHLDRDTAPILLEEIHRVLVPGGTIRVVVPDLFLLCTQYLSSYESVRGGSTTLDQHQRAVEALLEQSVRRESRAVPSAWPPAARRVATALLGDARRRGETHQWMYDAQSLPALLRRVGFESVRCRTPETSSIPLWSRIDLDRNAQHEYKPGSLYVEGERIGA